MIKHNTKETGINDCKLATLFLPTYILVKERTLKTANFFHTFRKNKEEIQGSTVDDQKSRKKSSQSAVLHVFVLL